MYRVPPSDHEQLKRLLELQRLNPTVDGLPHAARIGDLPLFIGDAHAATDTSFLEDNGIDHVISLGTGRITPTWCNVMLIDILDAEDELILPHLDKCIDFIRTALSSDAKGVLVHCVYGQSRSASICVAYLMAEHRMHVEEAFHVVRAGRPCIYINPSFLCQLQLFDRMGKQSGPLGTTNAHAEWRALLAGRTRIEEGRVRLYDQIIQSGPGFYCNKCNYHLGSERNTIHRVFPGRSGKPCQAIFMEPLKWMRSTTEGEDDFGHEKDGKLHCPKCSTKLGAWTWTGTKCQCGVFVAPAFQLTPSRVRFRT